MHDVVVRLRAAGCVFAEDEARILLASASTSSELEDMVDRRASGEPLEHVVGWVEWGGLRLSVEPGVFVPRRRTEALARTAASSVRPGDVVVDLCCGNGAVAAFIVAAVPEIELVAVDLDPAAVTCARRNLPPSALVLQGDLLAPLEESLRGRVHVIVANAPYVPTGEIRLLPPEARLHEPGLALDGGADGLQVLRRVVADAVTWLAPGGHVLVETSAAQSTQLAADAEAQRLTVRTVVDDELGTTVLVATKPS